MDKNNKNKLSIPLTEIKPEKDISAYLQKVDQAIFGTFEKYNIPAAPIGEWGILCRTRGQVFDDRLEEIQEDFHQKKMPMPLDLIQAQAIIPYLIGAERNLALGNCEELAFNVASIVYEFAWPSKIQPRLTGQEKYGNKSPLTLGVIQLVQYAEDSPIKYTGEKMLALIEILANDDRFTALNKLELELVGI